MGWFGFGKADHFSGSSGKRSTVNLNVKTDKSGRATHVLVSKQGNPHKSHTHYYKKAVAVGASRRKVRARLSALEA